MAIRHLNAHGKGEYTYDYNNDILLFKIKGREYATSLEFDNLVLDIDKEGFITGLQVFDASAVFRLSKLALNNIKEFEFKTTIENKVITVQLRFTPILRNKKLIRQGQDFVREAVDAGIKDSEVVCTVA
ncbi:DUF2283 domain-containing protein [Candidatus Woesearchaeota archaeon]|nr:DUF2283 domain-containing protein [Candidatus Woesearchaeota archaeon]